MEWDLTWGWRIGVDWISRN